MRPQSKRLARWVAAGAVLMVLLAVSSAAEAEHSLEASTSLPSQHLILGVPFVSWAEAARLPYQQKEGVNPSTIAAMVMVLKYWDEDITRPPLRRLEPPDNWVTRTGKAKGLRELKALVARGIPVVVSPAQTPYAHPPAQMVAILTTLFENAEFRGSGLPPKDRGSPCDLKINLTKAQYERVRMLWAKRAGFLSGVLGKMESLEEIRRMQKVLIRIGMSPNCIWESLHESQRVIIGYDDRRKFVVLHDPAFGPAWQVSYQDFEAMWQARDRWYVAAYPPDYAVRLADRSPGIPYGFRSEDQQAAQHFAYSYALASVDKIEEAEKEAIRGMKFSGISRGYRHLLLFQLAQYTSIKGEKSEAIDLTRRAITLLPEHHRPWLFMAGLHRISFTEDWQRKAADADREAMEVCSGPRAQDMVARTLARDFFVFGCKGILGPPN